MPDPSLFHGIAVLIDDEIEDANAGIHELKTHIEAAGCHVVSMSKLPEAASMANLREVSFFILDWNLYGKSLRGADGGPAAVAPPALVRQNALGAIDFLKKIQKVCVAPVLSLRMKMWPRLRNCSSRMRSSGMVTIRPTFSSGERLTFVTLGYSRCCPRG